MSNSILAPFDRGPRHNWADPSGSDMSQPEQAKKGQFLYFYTRSCRYCERMGENVAKVNKDLLETTGRAIEMFDIQGDPMHMMAYERYAMIPKRCMGVPFMYNLETEDFICGFTSYENLKDFARV